MRISDWSSDVCSSDLDLKGVGHSLACNGTQSPLHLPVLASHRAVQPYSRCSILGSFAHWSARAAAKIRPSPIRAAESHSFSRSHHIPRSDEHTSELQSLMRISYPVFCLKKQKKLQYTPH